MKVIFNTNIDKYRGKFVNNFEIVPRIGEFIMVDKPYTNQTLPFDKLQVVNVIYKDKDTVLVELHLSEMQAKENIAYNLGVFL